MVFLLQVVSALHYLHTQLKVIHRDVKPSNILINRRGEVKMCDFGISGYLVDSVAKTVQAGCKPYMAVSIGTCSCFATLYSQPPHKNVGSKGSCKKPSGPHVAVLVSNTLTFSNLSSSSINLSNFLL